MAEDTQIKRQVREFYDQVGWMELEDGIYQNAHYEDLRPVSREYIQRCHQRVSRHLNLAGKFLLDAGSGPIQYPAYLEYSSGYEKRICADISITALKEARSRIGQHGLFVVMDIAHLPFKANSFDGMVSLHTIHHLPKEDHIPAYRELHRVLTTGASGVVVNGWDMPPLGRILETPIRIRKSLRRLRRKQKGGPESPKLSRNTGTFVRKYNAAWLKSQLSPYMPVEIFVWRSVSVAVLRFYIHAALGGRLILKMLYALEEALPRLFGRIGQYPLVVIQKH